MAQLGSPFEIPKSANRPSWMQTTEGWWLMRMAIFFLAVTAACTVAMAWALWDDTSVVNEFIHDIRATGLVESIDGFVDKFDHSYNATIGRSFSALDHLAIFSDHLNDVAQQANATGALADFIQAIQDGAAAFEAVMNQHELRFEIP